MSDEVTRSLCGFAWFVFPDPRREPLSCGLDPYSSAAQPDLFWWIEGDEEGIHNAIWGDTYLTVTASPEHPRIDNGWTAEPADLSEDFEADEGRLRLRKVLGVRRTPWGIVQECEFEVEASESGLVAPRTAEAADRAGRTTPIERDWRFLPDA